MPHPEADPNAPRVQPRGERTQPIPADPNAVTPAELEKLFADYRARIEQPKAPFEQFHTWAQGVLKTDRNLKKVAAWTRADVQTAQEAML